MGFFKKLFSARRAVIFAMEEQERQLLALAALPPEQLVQVEDARLCEVLSFLNDRKLAAMAGEPHKRKGTPADWSRLLSAPARDYYLLDLYALHMEEGGFCEVLTADERACAWELPGLLRKIGAEAHAALTERFFADHAIDPHDLSSFAIGRTLEDDYAAQEARYPYADYNRAYAELEPLLPLLAAFGRAHLKAFLE